MKRDCVSIEELIWDAARDGTELPEEALRHIEHCEECARASAEAEAGLRSLRAAMYVSAGRDCRSAVSSRIAQRRGAGRKARLAWALAAVVVTIALLIPSSRKSVDRKPVSPVHKVVRRISPSRPKVSSPNVHTPTAAVATRPSQMRGPRRVRRSRHVSARVSRLTRKDAPAVHTVSDTEKEMVTAANAVPSDQTPDSSAELVAPEDETVASDTAPMAEVLICWNPPDQETDRSYAYSKYDSETGITTRCKVTDTGGSVRVDLESAPNDDGGIRHETSQGP